MKNKREAIHLLTSSSYLHLELCAPFQLYNIACAPSLFISSLREGGISRESVNQRKAEPERNVSTVTAPKYSTAFETDQSYHRDLVFSVFQPYHYKPKFPSNPPRPVGVLMSGIIIPWYSLSLPGVDPYSQDALLNSSPLVRLSSLKLRTLCGGAWSL